ncbi:MAG: AAA family ATPase, partial [Epsilonproteobacteria bacterium]|nr:AAA family ATPase [Campylobacterota bacterium]
MKLPIGISSFREIRENGYIYVDKTKEALEAINNYKYLFLSRPRRFGKSLFVDTLKHIFEGNKELFEGLYIYDKYDFEKYPVIKIDWAGDFKTLESTKNVAKRIFELNQERLGIECKIDEDVGICFNRLIQEAYKKYKKRVVVLIDEYDKPILDNLDNLKRAAENRDFLRGV